MSDAQSTSTVRASDAVNKMYRDSELFMSRYNALVSIAPYVRGTSLEPRFVALVKKGKTLRSRIETTHNEVRDAYARAGKIIAASWTKMREFLTDGSEYGTVALPESPTVTMAVSAAASAASIAMLGWSREVDQFIATYNGEAASNLHPVAPASLGELSAEKTFLEKMGLPSVNSLGRLALVLGVVWGVGKWRKWW